MTVPRARSRRNILKKGCQNRYCSRRRWRPKLESMHNRLGKILSVTFCWILRKAETELVRISTNAFLRGLIRRIKEILRFLGLKTQMVRQFKRPG